MNNPPPAECTAPDVSRPPAPADTASVGASAAEEPIALTGLVAHLRFWVMVAGGLTADLWSKDWAVHAFRFGEPPVDVIPYVLQFQTMFNSGALFGIGQGQTGLFLVASVLALTLVLWMFAQSPRRQWLVQIALGGIFAGALGNLYDRMYVRLVQDAVPTSSGRVARYFEKSLSEDGQRILLVEYPPTAESVRLELPLAAAERLAPEYGYVRDFIKIPTTVYGRELWPWVFNLADMLLVCGVGTLAIRLLLDGRRPPARVP